LAKLKHVSRWLLGRVEETFWDLYNEDDREFDLEDGRRLEIQEYIPGKYNPATYGERLPLELRVKLGIFRLRLGDEEYEEAMVSLPLVLYLN
jgi:general transcription factor 3C polypeptide 3 (transcription factor C subunit 4)